MWLLEELVDKVKSLRTPVQVVRDKKREMRNTAIFVAVAGAVVIGVVAGVVSKLIGG